MDYGNTLLEHCIQMNTMTITLLYSVNLSFCDVDVKPKNILPALRSETSRIHHDVVVPSSLIALKGLCELKEVKLDARFGDSDEDDADSEMIKMAKSLFATMLVVTPSVGHMTR